MWPVRDAAWMQRDRAALNAAARTEIAAHVKENFIRLDVVMDPGDFDCFGMRIEHARRKCTNNIAADLERLMDRRRLMDCPGDRLKILRVESKRIQITVTADGIEGMMREG